MRKYRDGTVTMPFSELYGMRVVEVDKGRAVTAFAASEWFGLFSREVAPGVIAAVANATWWGAALTLLQPGDSFAALDQVVRFPARFQQTVEPYASKRGPSSRTGISP